MSEQAHKRWCFGKTQTHRSYDAREAYRDIELHSTQQKYRLNGIATAIAGEVIDSTFNSNDNYYYFYEY